MARALASLLTLLPLLALACGGGAAPTPEAKLQVVTTVAPITSIVESIGGSRIRLEGIIPEGVNSHTFEPAPSVARLLARADLIVLNGLFLEEPTLRLAEANKRDGAVVLRLGEGTVSRQEWAFDFSFPESAGRPNPHLWPDPILALRYAELVQEQLAQQDATNAGYYGENLAHFRRRIERLDAAIRAAVQTIPRGQRKLLTYHDSWAYFARRYGMEVIGAVQPADFAEPSAREVARLIDQLREVKVPAVFGSEVFPSKVLEQIAREAGARFIDKLRDDDLPGKPGDPRHSYLGLMLENMEIMVPALGGDAAALAGVDVRPVFEGASGAIYPQ
ncbi:MAG: zinc ABC transporter substrate-binding protein [Chloroflexi bacterium]|nr:zinc ABC transporter substrate-binding protein [Chloroflexota bacterium]